MLQGQYMVVDELMNKTPWYARCSDGQQCVPVVLLYAMDAACGLGYSQLFGPIHKIKPDKF